MIHTIYKRYVSSLAPPGSKPDLARRESLEIVIMIAIMETVVQ